MDFLTSNIIFYVFAALSVLTALGVVLMRSAVSSAMCMALSFACVAALLFGLGAHFLGIIQIIVYAGAIMVLFLFVVMLLQVKNEEKMPHNWIRTAIGLCIGCLFLAQLIGITNSLPLSETKAPCPYLQGMSAIQELEIGNNTTSSVDKASVKTPIYTNNGVFPDINLPLAAKSFPKGSALNKELSEGNFPDATLLGHTLFTRYNTQFILVGLTLLVATIGAVVLCRRPRKND